MLKLCRRKQNQQTMQDLYQFCVRVFIWMKKTMTISLKQFRTETLDEPFKTFRKFKGTKIKVARDEYRWYRRQSIRQQKGLLTRVNMNKQGITQRSLKFCKISMMGLLISRNSPIMGTLQNQTNRPQKQRLSQIEGIGELIRLKSNSKIPKFSYSSLEVLHTEKQQKQKTFRTTILGPK